ncbi:MAG: bifunctional methylenetetrahydrofolate dehydrogenase/methenyltetrahydrofolate cyclohydrolase FolD [Myxococcales bacterium]
MGKIIDGKAIAERVRAEVKAGAVALVSQRGVQVGLALVRVGEDPASALYVRSKIKACADVGFASFEHQLPAGSSQAELLELVRALNADARVHGILIQLPLPKGIDEDALLDAVDPVKDVDGFHPLNAGRLLTGRPGIRACTPFGIMRMLDHVGVELAGKRAVVVGRSNIVGKPMALLLLERHATVTLCHSRTRDLEGEVRRADVLVAAAGRPGLIPGAWIKDGAVVIDVGSPKGDVEFEAAREHAGWITPVPGGVGPMTVATLMANTLQAARRALGMA